MVIPSRLKDLYPFESRFFSVKQAGRKLRLHYLDEGPSGPGNDRPLVCLHGNPTWSFYFRNVVRHFRTKRRVLALDHMGCGASDAPQDWGYRLRDHCENMAEFMEQVAPGKVDLLVHDWGGAIGLGYAVRNPERVGRIILTNTAAFSLPRIPKRIALCRVPHLGEWAVRRLNAFARAAVYMAPARLLAREVKDGLLWPYQNYQRRIAVARFVQDIPLHPGHESWKYLQETSEGLPRLRVPRLILWGEKDFCFDMHFLNKWRELWPEASVRLFPEGGHYLLEDEAPACIQAMEEFFDEYRQSDQKPG